MGDTTRGASPLRRVVLADDSLVCREVLRDLLEGSGQFLVVAEASTGMEALERTRATLPDALVMDVAMPYLNGFEAARRILAEVPTPVLLVSALEEVATRDLRGEGLDPSTVCLFSKPQLSDPAAGKALLQALRRLCDLPVRRRWGPPSRPPSLARSVPLPRSGRPRRQVLLVEDSSLESDALRDYLEGEGFGVRLVRDASDGWMEAHRSPPDLVLSDVILPAGSGFDLCHALRASHRTRQVPVVLLSGSSSPLGMARALAAGAAACLFKPWDPALLASRLRQVLEPGPRKTAALPEREIRLGGETLRVTPDPQQLVEFLLGGFEDLLRAQGHLEGGRLQSAPPARSWAPPRGKGGGSWPES